MGYQVPQTGVRQILGGGSWFKRGLEDRCSRVGGIMGFGVPPGGVVGASRAGVQHGWGIMAEGPHKIGVQQQGWGGSWVTRSQGWVQQSGGESWGAPKTGVQQSRGIMGFGVPLGGSWAVGCLMDWSAAELGGSWVKRGFKGWCTAELGGIMGCLKDWAATGLGGHGLWGALGGIMGHGMP